MAERSFQRRRTARDDGEELFFAVETMLPFVAGFTDKDFGFGEGRSLTRTNLLCSGMMHMVLFYHRDGSGVERELVRLQLEIAKFRSFVEKTLAPQYLSGLSTPKFNLLDRIVHDSERFGSL